MKVDDPNDPPPRIPGPYVAPGAQNEEIEAQLGNARVRVRGSDIITGATLIAVLLIGWTLFEHRADAKDTQTSLKSSIDRMTEAQAKQVSVTREMNCYLAFPQDERRKEWANDQSVCKRLAQ